MQPLMHSAANGCIEPNSVIVISCSARSQREDCRRRIRLCAAVQQEIQPFMQAAAWIGARIHRSRRKCSFAAVVCWSASDVVQYFTVWLS